MASKRMARPDRIKRAADKYKLQTKDVEAALDRIERVVREYKRRRGQDFLGTKLERRYVKSLADAAAKTLAYAGSDNLPIGLRSLIAASEMLEMLQSLKDLCNEALRPKLLPKRDDGLEKRRAALRHYCYCRHRYRSESGTDSPPFSMAATTWQTCAARVAP
jgi:hypothetical protein